jgi:hypothetical protein
MRGVPWSSGHRPGRRGAPVIPGQEARAMDDRDLEPGAVDMVPNNVDVGPPTPFAWLPPRLVTCKVCASTVLTKEASPRCRRCGVRDSDD